MNENLDTATRELLERAKIIFLSTLPTADDKKHADRYLSMVTAIVRENNDIVFLTTNVNAAELLKATYADKIKLALTLAGDHDDLTPVFRFDESAKSTIVISPTDTQSNSNQPIGDNDNSQPQFISTMPLNPEYTFDEFVRGPSNSFALSAAMAVVNNPGKSSYNPLFIHGGTGLGKTHLMQAIGNKLISKNKNLAICYLTAEEYLNEYTNYMKDNRLHEFRKKYRSLDVLLIDDVQFFQKGKQIQEEFFNTFNALKQSDKQIVMTSDVAPKNMPAIETRLISRFEGGMLQEIESPSYETRLAILKKKMEQMNTNLSIPVLEFIADNIKSHIRAMEGALSKVSIYHDAMPNEKLSVDVLNHLLSDFIHKEQTIKNMAIEDIQNAVCKKYDVTLSQLISTDRTQSLVTPRQVAMYIARKFTTKSLPDISKFFERTHATILHGVKTIEKRLDTEKELKNEVEEILSQFGYKLSEAND